MLKSRGASRLGWGRRRLAGLPRVAALHDHDHRLRLLLGDQVVHDEGDVPLVRPAAFVLAGAVLQVQNWIPRIAIGIVAWRRVDEGAAPVLGRLGVVPALADLAVRHVLREVVIDALLRDLDAAHLLSAAVKRLAAGVVDLHAVDDQRVVVEARHDRVRGPGPDAVVALLGGIALAAEEMELDLLRVRRLDAERDAQVGVDAGILLARNVAGRGGGVGGLRRGRRIGGRGREERQQAGQAHAVHQWISLVG